MIDKLSRIYEKYEKMKNSKLSSCFFYMGIVCELLVSFSGYLIGGYGESKIIVAGMAFFSLSVLLSLDIKSWKKEFLLLAVLGAYGLACYYYQSSAFILRIELAILAGRKQDAKVVIKMFFWGTLAGMLYYGILSVLGQHNYFYLENSYRSVVERRYTFGFFHPNGYAYFLFRLAVLGLYTYIDKMKLWLYFLISAILVGFIIPSKSKIGIVIIILVVLIFALYKYANKKCVVAICLSIMAMAGLLWIYIKFQDFVPENDMTFRLWMFVDKVTTGRSGDSYYAMLATKPTLMGVGLNVVETSEMGIVDSIYCQGIIFMLAFLIITIWLFVKKYRDGDIAALILISLTIGYATAESFLEYFNKNTIWLLCIGTLFVSGNKQIKQDNN